MTRSTKTSQLQYDRFKNDAAAYTPSELMALYAEIGRRSIFGEAYRPFIYDSRTKKYWRIFVKLRRYLAQERINPRFYFQALFDYAVAKRRPVQKSPKMYDPRFTSKLWRPMPSLLMHPLYKAIFERWMEKGGSTDAFTQSEHEDQRPGRRAIASLPNKVRITNAVRLTAELVRDFPKLYPGMKVRDILGIVFTELSAHYLYFLPEAQELIKRGAGTRTQRRVFLQLTETPRIRERYQRLFNDLRELPTERKVRSGL